MVVAAKDRTAEPDRSPRDHCCLVLCRWKEDIKCKLTRSVPVVESSRA